MKHLAILAIVMIFTFFIALGMYQDEKYIEFNKRPFIGWLFSSLFLWIILEILLISVDTIIESYN